MGRAGTGQEEGYGGVLRVGFPGIRMLPLAHGCLGEILAQDQKAEAIPSCPMLTLAGLPPEQGPLVPVPEQGSSMSDQGH